MRMLTILFFSSFCLNFSIITEEKIATEEQIFTIVPHMPIFIKSCDEEKEEDDKNKCSKLAFFDYLKEASLSKKYQSIKTEGRVYVSFVVEKDGSVSTVKLLRGSAEDSRLDKLAINHVKKMPSFYKAGSLKDSTLVKVKYNIPVDFKK